MKQMVHINVIENAIDWIFSERINQSDLKEKDICLNVIESDGVDRYVNRKIDRRDKAELHRIAQINLSNYLKEHPDNTFEMFKEVRIEKAKEYQTYFPDYKTNNRQKEIYFDLQAWIEVIGQLIPKENNPKYSVLDIVFENEYEYRSLKSQIERNGCFNIIVEGLKTFVYTPELGYILTKENLQVENCDTKEIQIINGQDFMDDYANGFKEGVEHFKQEHAVGNDVLYGVNAEHYVNDIHNNYFHIKHTGVTKGWVYYKNSYPILLKKEHIRTYGFYAGILSEVEALVKKHPQIFENLEKCEHHAKEDDLQLKNKIAAEIIGLTGKYNEPKTIQPVFYYINDVLKEYNITPLEAKEIILQMKGSFSPDWNKNIIPLIVEHLGLLMPQQNQVIQQNDKNNISETPKDFYPRIFKNPDSYLFFESLKSDVRERYKLADYSFIYRRMQKDGYIYVNVVDTEFREFLFVNFSIEIDKTKLLDYCRTDIKESSYTTKKGLFKHL